ncbi:hypothetical protein EBR57_08410, partial [bacterium]|nr:hypothetical protein [bacterium]
KHLYLVFHERYKNENASIYIERFGAKHPLLKPEFIVVNDQVHGFKKQNDRYLGLEKFPIFVELEYADDEGEKLVEGIDIHAEANIKLKDKLSDVVKLATYFEKTVVVERTRLLTDSSEESLIIYSKIGEMYAASYIEDDLDEGELSEDELTAMIEKYLTSFSTFLQALDELTGRRKKTSVLDGLYKLDGNE